MKVVQGKNETKKRKRDETQDPIDESPKKAKVHAQRKFAQGASYNSPSITLIKDNVRPPSSVTSPGLVLSAKRPNTEDFLTFLCFRRTSILPPKLDFFKDAFKQQPVPSNCDQKTPNSSKSCNAETAIKSSSKKSEKNEINHKKAQTSVQVLRRKYQEQRLAKQRPTNVTKLAQKVKGKNMVRTRSSTVQEEKIKPAKELSKLNDSKDKLSGLRSGLQRSTPTRTKLLNKKKKIIEVKNLRSRLKRKTTDNVAKSNPFPDKKVSKPKEVLGKKSDVVKTLKTSETSGKVKDVRINTKKIEGLSDFSSDDNEPLLAVRKGKSTVKGKKLVNGVKDMTRTNTIKTRSQITEVSSTVAYVPVRPTRKTKEAAALYMEMITKKLVSPEKSGDDDRSSVDSFPELPNAKRNEQRESEIKARAMAMKKGFSKETNTNSNAEGKDGKGKERGHRGVSVSMRKREIGRKCDATSVRNETEKKLPKENPPKKVVKEESQKRVARESPKNQFAKITSKKSIKEDMARKLSKDEPAKKIFKEGRVKSPREEQGRKSVRDEKKVVKGESTKKTKDEAKTGTHDDSIKKTTREDASKKSTRDETAKRISHEDLPKKEESSKKKASQEETTKPPKKSSKDGGKKSQETIGEDSGKKIKEEFPKKAVKDDYPRKSHEEVTKKLTIDEMPKKELSKKIFENQSKKELNPTASQDEFCAKNLKNEVHQADKTEKISEKSVQDIIKKNVKEDTSKKAETLRRESQDDVVNKITKDEVSKKTEITKKGWCEDSLKRTTKDLQKKPLKGEIENSGSQEEQLNKTTKEDETRKGIREETIIREELLRKEKDEIIRKEEVMKNPENITNTMVKEEYSKSVKDDVSKKFDKETCGNEKNTQKEELVKIVVDEGSPKKEGKEGFKDDPRVKKEEQMVKPWEEQMDEVVKSHREKMDIRVDKKSEVKEASKNKLELEKKDIKVLKTKEAGDEGIQQMKISKDSSKGDTDELDDTSMERKSSDENEPRLSARSKKQDETEVKPKKGPDRAGGVKKSNPLPKKGCTSGLSMPSSSWLPPPGSDSSLVEAPTFYPTEKEFQDPLEFFERIRPAAEKFGLCRIVPPSTFKPDCKVSDDMRFTAYNQYVHRMYHRWGPNIKEMMAIKKYLATQSISLKQPPWIGGIEVDLPRLYQSVQNCGGLMKVMEKKKWHQVADMMRIPKAAQDRVTKLDDIYCKYLLPYDTLSHDERQKLFDEVENDWLKRQESTNETTDDESEEESYIDECEECIVKGRNMALNQFYRIARNTMSMWFKTQDPAPSEVENEFWRHVSERTNHVCVHSGSIDSSGWGYGFPVAKNNSFSRHPWNLKVLTNNSGSVLRSLGPVMGVTVPTLHVGMLFTAFCWYRDPHGLPWVEYLHTGAPKIWYGISDDNSSVFKDALTKLLPRYIKNKKIWLPSDTAMVPPALLVEQGVSLCHTIQKPGQFILVFPRAFTSSICTGYLVSESVYFAQPNWLNTAEQVFRDIQDSSEPTMFSLEKLIFSIATDTRSSVEVLKQVLPMVWHIKQNEIDGRKTLLNLGLKASERLPLKEQGGGKKRKGRWAQDDEGDYECEICRTNLCVSLVINSQEEGVLCLPHAIEFLTQKRHHLKYCKLMYSYTQEELCELVEKLEQRIESKSQKKVQSKTGPVGK